MFFCSVEIDNHPFQRLRVQVLFNYLNTEKHYAKLPASIYIFLRSKDNQNNYRLVLSLSL